MPSDNFEAIEAVIPTAGYNKFTRHGKIMYILCNDLRICAIKTLFSITSLSDDDDF